MSAVNAQSYKKVKVTLTNGLVQKGSEATISDETVSFNSEGEIKTYPLSDVSMIQAKKGSAEKWALGCGGGCLAVEVISGIVSGTDGIEAQGGTVGQFIVGTVLLTGISAGVGYLIGSLTDHDEIVYNKNLSLLNNIKFNVTTDQLTKQGPKISNLTLSFRF